MSPCGKAPPRAAQALSCTRSSRCHHAVTGSWAAGVWMPSHAVQTAYHEAAGAVLVGQGKYAEAIPHLEEDNENPASMERLWKAYKQTGASEDARLLGAKLANLNEPTVEQALIVPGFRTLLADQQQQAVK